MAHMNMVQALNSAMDIMLERDPRVVVLGEDVGYFGGVFRCTDGLQRKYGEQRVLDTPIAEGGIVAAAIGMGVNGLKPVAEIQFADYIYPAFDQIVSELARLRYRTAGEFSAPVTIRTPCGGGIRGGQTHSQSPEGVFTHVCGIKVVMPSNPVRREGTAHQLHRGRGPGGLLRAQAASTTAPSTAIRTSRPCPGARIPGAPCRRATTRCSLSKAEVVRPGNGCDRACLRHDGARGGGGRQAGQGRRGDHRCARARAARYRYAVHLGLQDRPLCHRARGDALQWLRRRAGGHGAGGVLLAPGGADRPRHRLGHSLSARIRVGVFPGTGAHRRGADARDGGRNEPVRLQAAGPRRGHRGGGDRRPGA